MGVVGMDGRVGGPDGWSEESGKEVGQIYDTTSSELVRIDGISKSIDLLWDAVVAVAAVATHSASVPQTYPPRPQHAHSSPARIHSTTEPRLSITLLSHCRPYLSMQSAFN